MRQLSSILIETPPKIWNLHRFSDNCLKNDPRVTASVSVDTGAVWGLILDYQTQSAITCSKLKIETLEQGVKCVQS